jgi:hypothetical protein
MAQKKPTPALHAPGQGDLFVASASRRISSALAQVPAAQAEANTRPAKTAILQGIYLGPLEVLRGEVTGAILQVPFADRHRVRGMGNAIEFLENSLAYGLEAE